MMNFAPLSEENTMVLFPNRETTHPDDVRERVERECRKHGGGTQPWDLVDQASQDSFPASDVPPWTLGHISPPVPTSEVGGGVQGAGSHERPGGSPQQHRRSSTPSGI
jgi:hypothetical protein